MENNFLKLTTSNVELCFDQNELLKSDFSIDFFLHKNRAVSLETFRDDLGIYLKILRSAMIELINEDYADFVNLSANLVNLDKAISQLKDPLFELRDEIVNVRTNLQDCMNEINECLNEKRRFRQIKKSLKTLEVVRASLDKLKHLVQSIETCEKINRAILLERAALELIQLQFNVKFCQQLLESDENTSISELEKKLLDILNDFFLSTLATNDGTDNLERCLRIYYTLDKCSLAENIFRKETSNYMKSVISERNLQNNPNGLAGIYNQILDFASLKMKNLLTLTRGKTMKIKGYNFLFNSFWSAMEERLEMNLSSIFAPGDPQNFYQKYKCTLEFLTRVEMLIDDTELIGQFHQLEQYQKFQNRWNLPVYFQIRFQEIAANLERACDIDWDNMLSPSNESNQIQVKVFVEAINCVARCWVDGVYLDQLYHKFLKLTLQLIARIVHWIEEVLHITTSGSFDHPNVNLQSFYTTLHRDIDTFMLKLPQIEQLVLQKLSENPTLKDQLDPESIKKCFDAPRFSFEGHQRTIEKQIVKKLMTTCLKSIKNVQDVPRLFRKTNRDVPTKHLPYVEQIVQPIDNFKQKNSINFQPEVVKRILKDLFDQLTIQYYQSVDEVLTSVQKTEESLRRLKNLREKSQQQSSSAPGEKQLMTDDDKIRLQLQIDVMHYVRYIELNELNRDEIDSLMVLVNLIGDLTKMKITVG